MGIFDKLRKRHNNSKVKEAETLYQVTEFNQQLWLTHNGSLVAPFNLITKENTTAEITALVTMIRKLYVERNT